MTAISADISPCDICPLFTKLCPYSFETLVLIIGFYLLFPLSHPTYCQCGLFYTRVQIFFSCSWVLLEYCVKWLQLRLEIYSNCWSGSIKATDCTQRYVYWYGDYISKNLGIYKNYWKFPYANYYA